MNAHDDHADENAKMLAVLIENRKSRRVPYAFLTAAATCSLFLEQPSSVSAQLSDTLSLMFSLFWTFSSLLCFLGAVTDYWILEWWGLLPMVLSFLTFGSAILIYGQVTGLTVLPAGLAMLAIGGLFRSRRKDLTLLWKFSGGEIK